MPSSVSVPPHLIQYVASPANTVDSAAEALEEWIVSRRGKGDTLFEVSVGLAELEDRVRAQIFRADVDTSALRYSLFPSSIRDQRTTTYGPDTAYWPVSPLPLRLSCHYPASSPFAAPAERRALARGHPRVCPHARSQATGEEAWAGRQRHPWAGGFRGHRAPAGGGGRGIENTRSGRDAAQRESADRPGADLVIADVAVVFHLGGATAPAPQARYAGRGTGDRAAYPEAGGWGRTLCYRQGVGAAGGNAFKSAKARTTMPDRPVYNIALPAPTKSGCIKLISTFIKDVDGGGPSATTTPIGSPAHGSTPSTPLHSLSTLSKCGTASDPNTINHFVFELVCEFLTREKREYMLKCKWAIKGRDALSKDLGDIEAAVCLGKGGTSAHAAELIPAFLVLRRSFNLPKSTLPISIIEPYLDLLPALPDADDVAYREPSVANITAKLYMNPRLDDAAAFQVLEELMDSERELVDASGASEAEKAEWLAGVIDQIAKRFPDGSYESVFARTKEGLANPSAGPAPSEALAPPKIHKQPSLHRRALSSATSSNIPDDALDNSRLPLPQSLERRLSHNRSASLPSRKAFDEAENDSDLGSDTSSEDPAPTPTPFKRMEKPVLPALTTDSRSFSNQFLSAGAMSGDRSSAGSAGSGGWWDVISAVDNENQSALPWASPPKPRPELTLPPGAEAARAPELASPLDESFNKLDLDFSASPASPTRRAPLPMPDSSPARRAMARTMNSSPSSSPGSESSPRSAPPVYRPPPVPINFDRPSFPSPTIPSSSLPSSTPDRSPPPVKSKLGTFGRSLSIASKTMLARAKEKEREKEVQRELQKEIEREEREKEVEREGNKENAGKRDKVQNAPGKWNKDMVANIMGPPMERK